MNKQTATLDSRHAFSASHSLEATQTPPHLLHDDAPHVWTATAAAMMSAALAEFLDVFSQPFATYALDKQSQRMHSSHSHPACAAYSYCPLYDTQSQLPPSSTSRQQHIEPQVHRGLNLLAESIPASSRQHLQAATGALPSQSNPPHGLGCRQNGHPVFTSPAMPLQSKVLESRVIALPVHTPSQMTTPSGYQHDSPAQLLLPIAPLQTQLSPASLLHATPGMSASSIEQVQHLQLPAVDQQPQSGDDKACPSSPAGQESNHSHDHMALAMTSSVIPLKKLGSVPAPATPEAADGTGLKRKKGGQPQASQCGTRAGLLSLVRQGVESAMHLQSCRRPVLHLMASLRTQGPGRLWLLQVRTCSLWCKELRSILSMRVWRVQTVVQTLLAAQ